MTDNKPLRCWMNCGWFLNVSWSLYCWVDSHLLVSQAKRCGSVRAGRQVPHCRDCHGLRRWPRDQQACNSFYNVCCRPWARCMDGSGGRTWVLLHFTFVRGRVTTVTKIREISGGWDGGKLRNLFQFWLQNILQILHNKFQELLKSIILIYVNRTVCF